VDGSVERRKVEVGLDNKTTAEIRSGLEKGERVVVGEGSAQRQSSPSSRRGGGLF
jgi:membrane fusion protein, macrolide-specific efflux system